MRSSLTATKEQARLSTILTREGAGCGSVGDVSGAWLASAPLWPSLWTRGERSPWLPFETRPDSPGEPGCYPEIPAFPGEEY